jgi:hypothetical protein
MGKSLLFACGTVLAGNLIQRGGDAMSSGETVKKGDYKDLIFKQAIVAVYKLVDTVERMEDRVQELERRVDELTVGINKEVRPIFYS